MPVGDGNSPPCTIPWSLIWESHCLPLKIILSIAQDCMVVILPIIMGVYRLNKRMIELFEVTRNSLEVLSSMLSKETEAKPTKDELTESMLEKCKQSQPVIQMTIESTTDDDGILLEALNLNDELQLVIAKFEELEAGSKSGRQLSGNSGTTEANVSALVEAHNENMTGASPSTLDKTETSASPSTHNKAKMSASHKADGTESSSNKKNIE